MENLDLLTRYGLFDAKVPRYTSYPPANHFQTDVGLQAQRGWLSAVPDGSEISVYIHIPFCRRLCWFCACRTQGTKTLDPVAGYITQLVREIGTVAAALPGGVRMSRLHLGGGTPTILSPHLMKRLLAAVFGEFTPAGDFEFSVEIDPTDAAPDLLAVLSDHGLNRASIGVQDFDPVVQGAIGRQQSFAQTRDVVDWLRDAGVPSLNLDLLYGLPHQTAATFGDTIERVLSLEPDRLAIYGYAHVPWMSKRQVMIRAADLPDPLMRLSLSEQARTRFEEMGFQSIGIDHFARPDDPLALADAAGVLRRNFQGYTDDASPTLIGFGASAISRFAQGYVQNAVATSAYHGRIEETGFAGSKGFALTPRDRLIATMIEDLMCRFRIDLQRLHASFPDRWSQIETYIAGLMKRFPDVLERRCNVVTLRPEARMLVRIIAHDIDGFRADLVAHSVAV
ncbi:coproporphyrinogen III oxidase [Loktanella sp. 3ANDIMAR09]|uniref:oxygen-independent coproporphyrinogen III oxidase n=1 Tax=Loktanella sp. 3ANDIMAR09 TaxID=1225657 RepID=UPI0006F1D368|nr:oxygen-independent coproporphyrinogen III oxidase [Loktanella sp. 3ANDIMAR09]KQI67564.1 coproporphyrinogen III oxidase [Loktanella sp. 3ANDIMAR09]